MGQGKVFLWAQAVFVNSGLVRCRCTMRAVVGSVQREGKGQRCTRTIGGGVTDEGAGQLDRAEG